MLVILVMVSLLIKQLNYFLIEGSVPATVSTHSTNHAHSRTSAGCVFSSCDCLNKKKLKKINLERTQREVQTQRVLPYLHLVVQRWNCVAMKYHPVISEFDIHRLDNSVSQLVGQDPKTGCFDWVAAL